MISSSALRNPPKNCPKCAGIMELGFITDYTSGGGVRTSDWVEGEPLKSFRAGIKIKDKKLYSVRTYRCVNCGFLESYATEEKQ